jgi:hypothetical protein
MGDICTVMFFFLSLTPQYVVYGNVMVMDVLNVINIYLVSVLVKLVTVLILKVPCRWQHCENFIQRFISLETK